MRIAVFMGSNPGFDARHLAVARQLGTAIAGAGHGVVYGGGRVGLMGAVADAALAAGAEVIGVIPEGVLVREVAHTGLADLRIVGSMHERKALMAELADAFVVLPGGLGTFDEMFEQLTWLQLGMHRKPVVVLDPLGYFDPLFALVDGAVHAGFMRPEHRALLARVETVEAALEAAGRPPVEIARKWLDEAPPAP